MTERRQAETAPGLIPDHIKRGWPWLVAFLLSGAFFAQTFVASSDNSLTWDEPTFIASGYAYWKWGAFEVNPSHPPLLQMLQALPLVARQVPEVAFDDPAWRNEANPAYALGQKLVYRSGVDPAWLATWARLPTMLLGALLVLCLFAWAKQMWGTAAGLTAAALAASEPNLLAHGMLATEDLGCTTLMCIACWLLHRALRQAELHWRGFVLCGVVTGFALLSKYTALLLAPIFGAMVLAHALSTTRERAPWARLAARLATVAALALLVVGLGYKGTFDYAAYVRGVRSLYSDMRPDQLFYLAGELSTEPFWYFTLASLLVKLPLGLLGLLGLSLTTTLLRPRRHWRSWVILLFPASLILLVSFFDVQNLGVRRVLPAFPFLILLAARAARDLGTGLGRGLIVGLVAAVVVVTVRIHPHYLSFFNSIAGGPEAGPYVMEDSNVDWGQDLPALAAWQRSHPEARPLRLLYFGSAVPGAYGVQAETFPFEDALRPRPGYYAVSATRLVRMRKLARVHGPAMDWLSRYRPQERAGYSIWIYRFPADP